jgi:hypothetical protein
MAGGFVSNIEAMAGGILIDTGGGYPVDPQYTGETIYALAAGPNMGGAIARGQLCYWRYDVGTNQYSFDEVDGSGVGSNAHMLAIALQDIAAGSNGSFLLKGFISVADIGSGGHLDVASPVVGEPLYMDRGTNGRYCNAAAWTGTPGTDIYRSIGYLVTDTAYGGNYYVMRFDPSSDYIV